jgi:predicted DNA binding protein
LIRADLAIQVPGNWIGNLGTACDMSVRVMRCVPDGNGGGESLLQIDAPENFTGTEVAERIRSIEPRCTVQLTGAGPGRYVGTVKNETCALCRLLAGSECFIESASSRKDGAVEWCLVASNSAALRKLVSKLEGIGCTVDLEKLNTLQSTTDLTRAQERVLQIAFDCGYFDIPRKINLDKLARRLEISKATLDVMLRRGQRKVVARQLGRVGHSR